MLQLGFNSKMVRLKGVGGEARTKRATKFQFQNGAIKSF